MARKLRSFKKDPQLHPMQTPASRIAGAIAFVLVLAVVGYMTLSNPTGNPLTGQAYAYLGKCTDSDGGKVGQEMISGSVISRGDVFQDTCNGKVLTEFKCDGQLVKNIKVTCKTACLQGACWPN